MFKAGDKVVCVNSGDSKGNYITQGKEYEVIKSTKDWTTVRGDMGRHVEVYSFRFKLAEPERTYTKDDLKDVIKHATAYANTWGEGMVAIENTVKLYKYYPGPHLLKSLADLGLIEGPPKPKVNPDDWKPSGVDLDSYTTVAYYLATKYPHLLDHGDKIGRAMAKLYPDFRDYCSASPAEEKQGLKYVRKYHYTDMALSIQGVLRDLCLT
jgi:hypothetical protein